MWDALWKALMSILQENCDALLPAPKAVPEGLTPLHLPVLGIVQNSAIYVAL